MARAPSMRMESNELTAVRGEQLTPVRDESSHGVSASGLVDIQRARILAAMIDVVSERGVGDATVSRVVARSEVSRRTFYELFEDREDCFLASFDEAMRRIAAVVVPAYEAERGWCERIRASMTALLGFLERDQAVSRLVVVETLGAGPAALERRRRVLAQVIAIVDEGCGMGKTGVHLPALTAEGLVGGVFSLIHARLLEEDGAPLIELLGQLMAMIVLPYLGPAAARRELARSTPAAAAGRVAADPLRALGMRLTYRTVRVLLAIGALTERGTHPSNRQVADAAGIRDQGQISKLLTRLEHLGLVENADVRVKGEPNAWTLTERGEDVQQTISGPNGQRP